MLKRNAVPTLPSQVCAMPDLFLPIFSQDSLGHRIADWPKLLHLYSRLKPGISIYEWMKAHSVEELGVDVRRFTSFGVIKVQTILASLRRSFAN